MKMTRLTLTISLAIGLAGCTDTYPSSERLDIGAAEASHAEAVFEAEAGRRHCVLEDGTRVRHGAKWRVDCNTCTCDSGQQVCTLIGCPSQCCDPAKEPGTHGNPFCIEGATCCSDGTWQCNEGDGSSTCSGGEGEVCPSLTCDNVLCIPGHHCVEQCDGNPTCVPDICEGFAGLECPDGFTCDVPNPHNPDEGGSCRQDCGGVCGACISDDQCGDGMKCTAGGGPGEDCLPWCDCPMCTVCAGHCVPERERRRHVEAQELTLDAAR
jgi:hypothetical protein